ncbi:transcriptional regulator [Bradyrhizobium sp. HKCCYLRH2015]|uniref:transcriptional regulator n=1 Tax=Bradyrhizobium sp. HKCCYLRH2015 TaxID=3420742 RepID=UPI003EBF8785
MSEDRDISELKALALGEAKRAAKGNTGLSRALNSEITPQAVAQWKQVPAARVLMVERATGVPRHLLRPDIYPAPGAEAAQ